MTRLAPGLRRHVSTAGEQGAGRAVANSLCHWVASVTSPVSCGRGLTSENQTRSPLTTQLDAKMPSPPRLPVTFRA